MTRKPDSSRKPALLEQILEFLLDKPLASLSFNTLAKALGVSTFTLVYHFGSRAELLGDIVWAISAREQDVQENLKDNPGTIDDYLAGLEWSWDWAVQPRNRQLQRLEFEASMMEAQDPTSHTFMRSLFAQWQKIGAKGLVALGLSEEEAEAETRLTVNTFFGLQYDLVVNQDPEAVGAAFELFLRRQRTNLEQLITARAAG